jgi:ClpP class serine protease
VDEFYAEFKARVSERRAADRRTIGSAAGVPARAFDAARFTELTDGRILTGKQACEAGLVDATGGVREAFGAAKSLAGLRAARLVKYYREDVPEPRTANGPSASAPGAAQGMQVNLVQIRADSLAGLGGVEAGGAYYLWLPPG